MLRALVFLSAALVACGASNGSAPSARQLALDKPPLPGSLTHVAPQCAASCGHRVIPGRALGRVLLDPQRAYFTDGKALFAQAFDAPERSVLFEGGAEPRIDAGDFLVACQPGSHPWGPGQLLLIPKLAGTSTLLAESAQCGATLIGADLYFIRLVGSDAARLERVSTRGGPSRVLAELRDAQPTPEGFFRQSLDGIELVTDSRDVFWVFDDGIWRFNVATDTLQRLTSITNAQRVVPLDGKLYCATDQAIFEVDPSGQSRIVANFQLPSAFTSGGHFVYWSSSAGLMRLDPKRGTLSKLASWPDYWPLSAVNDRVLFVARSKDGSELTLIEDCACTPKALPQTPAVRRAQPATPSLEFYLTSGDDPLHFVAADVSHDESFQVDALARRYAADARINANDPDIPARFDHGTLFLVHTTKGSFEHRVTNLNVSWDTNDGWQLNVGLGAPPAGERALVTRPGTLITFPPAVASTEDLPAKYLLAVQQAFAAAKIPHAVLREHVEVKLGRFPAPHVALITVDVPDPSDQLGRFAALFMGDSQGSITTALDAPNADLSNYILGDAIDLHADGFDDVFIDTRYYEGGSHNILVWTQGEPDLVGLRSWGQ